MKQKRQKLPKPLVTLLEAGYSPAFHKVYADRRHRLAADFLAHREAITRPPTLTDPERLALEIVQFLHRRLEEDRIEIQRLNQLLDDFNYRYHRAGSRSDRHNQILVFARQLGAGFWQLQGDRRALSRWFGYDAVTERGLRQVAARESNLIFILALMGALSEKALTDRGGESRQRLAWQQLNLEPNIQPLLAYSGDSRVRLQAFKCLVMAIRVLTPELQAGSLAQSTISFIYRSALESREDVWLQVEALNLLACFSLDTLRTVLDKRLSLTIEGDDMFVRKHCALLLGRLSDRAPVMIDFLARPANDFSTFVRQAVTEATVTALQKTGDPRAWVVLKKLAREDLMPQVRASALLACAGLIDSPDYFSPVIQLWDQALSRETDSFVSRTVMRAIRTGGLRLAEVDTDRLPPFCGRIFPILNTLHGTAADVCVRRWSAQTREWLIVLADPDFRGLFHEYQEQLRAVPPGRSLKLRRPLYSETDLTRLYRTLSVITQEDYGVTVARTRSGLRLWRGDVLVLRLWRVFFEFFHPSPNKRQGFKHTIGRTLPGRVRVPSAILSELTRTNVPGEPVYIPEEGGWRPYLPLVDEVLSSLFFRITPRPLRLYTSEGITVVQPPRSLRQRLRAWWRLTIRFQEYAELRNWLPQSRHRPEAYLSSLAELGFTFTLKKHEVPHGQTRVDPEVKKFFPAVLPVFNPELWQSFTDYFFSVYGNTLYEMGVFAMTVLALFLGRRLYLSHMGRRARHKLPLVIGGWGTRGKSGSERLKIALFEAMGYGTISKTTGTESMFLISHPMGRTREMMLFRPYDKASIWEQYAMNRWAAGFGTEVLLWECMGLNPAYVSILQNNWCRDDFSTITNAYPDHEDIQGPAGINIPQVMNEFIPSEAMLITAEEQMRPVLAAAARQKQTVLKSVDWLEAGLIAPDVLTRFPYQEHPHNIALVCRLAREFGISEDFAVKEMADRVVPDIGVLKAYPEAVRNSRRLVFVNGMAANDRFAALSNWHRMGFEAPVSPAAPDTLDAPGTPDAAGAYPEDSAAGLQSILVNNRADRVSRSKMFAAILVEDVSVDHIVLIGTNLTGLMSFIRDAWNVFIRDLDFSHSRPEQLYRLARHLRIPTTADLVQQRLAAILNYFDLDPAHQARLAARWDDPGQLRIQLEQAGLGELSGAIAGHIEKYRDRYQEFAEISATLAAQESMPAGASAKKIRVILEKWFFDKIFIIHDAHVSGEVVIQHLFDISPPGLPHRVMGMQNIKGPGLDFVYRWQSWETCFEACNRLRSGDEQECRRGLRQLAAFQDYGLLCEQYVNDTLTQVLSSPIAQNESFQAGLAVIKKTMATELAALSESLQASSRIRRMLAPLFYFIESFLDAGDGIRRRKAANRIYRDLKAGRVSHDRASVELTRLHKRQKGGWLFEQLTRIFHEFFRP